MTDNFDIPNGKEFIIFWDNVTEKLRFYSKDHRDILMLIEYFSDVNPAAFFVKQYGYTVPATISVINQFGFFEIGLIFEVLQYIKTMYGSLDKLYIDSNTSALIKRKMTPFSNFVKECPLEEFTVSNISSDRTLRDYQENIITNLIYKGYGCGLFESPTSSGKSFIIANYIWTIHKQINPSFRFMILVPNKQLVSQFYYDLLDYGFDKSKIAMFSAGVKLKDINLDDQLVIISNRQYLFNNHDKLPQIDALVCDECHQVRPDSASYNIIKTLSPSVLVGCSGTLPKEKYNLLTLKGLFGRIVHSENLLDLQNRGFITQLEIERINVKDVSVDEDTSCLFSLNTTYRYDNKDPDKAFNAAWEAESKYIIENFNRLYVPVLEKIIKNNTGNILILFDRIEFGKDLYELIKDTGMAFEKGVYYVDGGIPVKDREEIRANFEKSDNNLLLAQSATFSTGINIKNLPNIAFFFSGKAFSKVVQSIGRTLRLHKNKDKAHLIDVVFNFKYSKKHAKDRDLIYKEVYGKHKPDKITNITL